jgi:hypothetical protein
MKRTLQQATDEWLTSLENRNSRSHGGYSERMRMYVLPHLWRHADRAGDDGGDIFRLSKIRGHSSGIITQKTYAHLIPDAWEQDYRVSFTVPEQGTVYGITRRRAQLAAVP